MVFHPFKQMRAAGHGDLVGLGHLKAAVWLWDISAY